MNTKRRERIVDETEAANWIADGMTIAIGQPTPMALVRHIIRRGVKDLTVIDAGFSLDLLVAAGCVRKVISYYAGGGFGNPVMPAFRRAAERGEIEVWECEEGILCAGLQAAAQLLPFLPWRGGVGTSLPEVNRDLKVFDDPIGGEKLLAVPPIKPDLTILHAAAADAYGNVQHNGGPGWIDLFMYRAADLTIVQVERVIANEQVRADPWKTTIPAVDAIVRAPFGAHPFYSRGFYSQDNDHLREYTSISADFAAGKSETMTAYLDRYCRRPPTHTDYLEQIGIRRLLSLYEY
ncbi:MAG: CoA transferase subunit A [Deltaproteobacteria bacterium]|nr:CoA transferase subunit A [Deltaproteobacteria bacterium]